MAHDEPRELLYLRLPVLNEIVERFPIGLRPHGIDLSIDGAPYGPDTRPSRIPGRITRSNGNVRQLTGCTQ